MATIEVLKEYLKWGVQAIGGEKVSLITRKPIETQKDTTKPWKVKKI
jgi:hypothetical protein